MPKTSSERSAELYLAVLVREYGSIADEAIIVNVKDQSLDIYLFRVGVALRVGINNLQLDHPRTSYKKVENSPFGELSIFWLSNDPPEAIKQVLKPFERVNVDITSEFDMNLKKLKLTAVLRHPKLEKLTTFADLCTSTIPDIVPAGQQQVMVEQQRMDFDPFTEY